MDALPRTGLLPCMLTRPVTPAPAKPQFTRKIFPIQACLKDKRDAGQGGAVVNAKTFELHSS